MPELLLIDITDADTPEEAAEALLAALDNKLGKSYEFDPNQPRDEGGRWTDDGGGAAAHKDIADVIARPTETNPFKDKNMDGVTDSARVGVPGMEVPPPPGELPRIPNLTSDERAVESRFADAFDDLGAAEGFDRHGRGRQ